jgi:hypothetical protein
MASFLRVDFQQRQSHRSRRARAVIGGQAQSAACDIDGR